MKMKNKQKRSKASIISFIKFGSSLIVGIFYISLFEILKIRQTSFGNITSYFMLILLITVGILFAQAIWGFIISIKFRDSDISVSDHVLSRACYFMSYFIVMMCAIIINIYQYINENTLFKPEFDMLIVMVVSFIASLFISLMYYRNYQHENL